MVGNNPEEYVDCPYCDLEGDFLEIDQHILDEHPTTEKAKMMRKQGFF